MSGVGPFNLACARGSFAAWDGINRHFTGRTRER